MIQNKFSCWDLNLGLLFGPEMEKRQLSYLDFSIQTLLNEVVFEFCGEVF